MSNNVIDLSNTITYPGQQDQSPQNSEIIRLRSTHDLYKKYESRWKFYVSAYEGGEDFACPENLFKHQRENQEDYQDRVQRLHNLNYCEPLVDFFTNFIYSEPVERSGETNKDWFKGFSQNVNKRGDDIEAYMRDVSDEAQIYGMVYTIVDAPPAPENAILTVADEEDIKPYWVKVCPLEIVDWAVDDFGNFRYVKRKQFVDDFDEAGQFIRYERYTEYFIGRIVVSDIDVTDPLNPKVAGSPEEFATGDNEIPIAVTRYKRSKIDPQIGISFLRDFAHNNREVMNLTSLLQEFLYRQAFNILAREVDNLVPTMSQGESESTSNLMEIPKGAAMPQYLSPPAAPAEFIQSERARITSEIYKRAAQEIGGELANGEKSSGFSQAQSFSRTVPHINARATVLEATENKLMRLTMKKIGKEWDGKIKYKDRYELTNLTDALTQLQIICRDLLMPSETFVKEELKRIVREFDGKLPDDVRLKIEHDIETADIKEWMDDQKQALLGKGSISAGDQQKPKSSGTMAELAAESKQQVGATRKLQEAA